MYDIVDVRTGELAVNTRIDQIHMRLDQIIHMLAEIKRS
jgi:hypothetical protein